MTLQELRAEIEARKAMAAPIMEALKRGDLIACERAQQAMREKFPRQS